MKRLKRARGRWRGRIDPSRVCFLIFVVLMILLPIERVLGPMSTVPPDAALMTLTAFFWLAAYGRRWRIVFPLLLPTWLIFVGSGLATVFSAVPATNVLALVQELYIYVWFVSVANLLIWLGERDMQRISKVWVIVACVQSLLTLMGMVEIGPAFLHQAPAADGGIRHEFAVEGIGRALGTFRNANAAGGYIMTSIFVLLGSAWPRRPLPRLAAVGWLFLGIYATGSNASLGGALAGLALYLLYWALTQGDRRTARLRVTLGAMATAVGLALLVAFLSLASASQPRVGGALLRTTVWRLAGGVEKRLVVYDAGWDLFRQNVLGIGPNSTSDLVGGGLHNDYLAFLFERGVLGLIGLLLLIGLVMASVVASVRLARGDRVRQLQAVALGGGFVANFVDAVAHEITHSRSLWLLVAMVFAQNYFLRQRATQSSPVEQDASTALVAGGV